ncbi:MAG: carbon-nitrogen hydrolase family protein [Lachnospiraceae bacterium]|nr:carbon-nitrogen hydrolase family protein [Lachnospiraceae bacterium]
MLKIAMIQMKVEFHEADKNLAHAEALIKEAVAQDAQICVLPECMDLGWGTPKAVKLAEPIPGRTSDALCKIAKDNHVYIVSGITERDGNDIYNTALLISDEGIILGKHRKINVLTGVEDVYTVGNMLSIIPTPLGKIGIDICADNSIQSVSIGHTLARMGAQIILSPCAWAVPADRDPKKPYGMEWITPYSHLSQTFGIPIIGVSNVGLVKDGSWAGWKAIGNSIAYDRHGNLLTMLPYGEGAECVQVLDVELGEAEKLGTALAEEVFQKIYAQPVLKTE